MLGILGFERQPIPFLEDSDFEKVSLDTEAKCYLSATSQRLFPLHATSFLLSQLLSVDSMYYTIQ